MNDQQGIRVDNASATWPSEPRFSGDQRRPLLLMSQFLPLGSSLGGTLIPEPDGVADDFDDELQQLLDGLDEIGNDGVTVLRRLERTRSPPIVLKRAHKPVARHLHRGQHQRRQRQEEAEEQNDESDDDGGELSPTTLQIQRMLAELNGSGRPPTPPRTGAFPYNP